MAYYDALIAKWPSVAGATTADKLAALNAEVVAGPNVDVGVSTVLGELLLAGAYFPLEAFSQGEANGDVVHDSALAAAKSLVKLLANPNATVFEMSDSTKYAQIKGMMDVILAQELAQQGSTGFTQSVHDTLLALSSTTQTWWQANGYRRAINMGDVVVAGLDTTTGYSAQIGAPTSNKFNVQVSVTVTGPNGSETDTTFATTLDNDYAKYFAANCVQNMMTRDAALATF